MWIFPYTSIFSYTNWSYILSFHCHFSPSSMAKFEYLLTFLSAMICEICILMLEQRCKKIHSRFSETACKMSFDIVSTCSMAIFLEWMFDSSFFFGLHLYVFSFYCWYLPKRTFHCHFHLCYVIFNVFEMCVLCHCACKFRMDKCFTFEKCDLKFQISKEHRQKNIEKEHRQNITSLKSINGFFVFFFILTIKLKVSFK